MDIPVLLIPEYTQRSLYPPWQNCQVPSPSIALALPYQPGPSLRLNEGWVTTVWNTSNRFPSMCNELDNFCDVVRVDKLAGSEPAQKSPGLASWSFALWHRNAPFHLLKVCLSTLHGITQTLMLHDAFSQGCFPVQAFQSHKWSFLVSLSAVCMTSTALDRLGLWKWGVLLVGERSVYHTVPTRGSNNPLDLPVLLM